MRKSILPATPIIIIWVSALVFSFVCQAAKYNRGTLPGGTISKNTSVVWELTGNGRNEDNTGRIDYFLSSAIVIDEGATLTINNVSSKDLLILDDCSNGVTPITIKAGGKLIVNSNPSNKEIIFDGDNDFFLASSEESGGRYFLNCRGNSSIENNWLNISQKNVYCKHNVKNFIYVYGEIDFQNVTIQNFHSDEGLIVIHSQPTNLTTATDPRTIANFSHVTWYRNRCFNSNATVGKDASHGGTCILIRNVPAAAQSTVNPDSYRVNLEYCLLEENSMGTGAIRTYGQARSNIYLTESTFRRNYSAHDAGGAIHWNANSNQPTDFQPKLVIRGCVFDGNQAESHGGAIFAEGNMIFDESYPKDTEIMNNVAGNWDNKNTADYGRGGGAIRISGYPYNGSNATSLTYIFPSNLKIHNNSAEYGGGILIHYPETSSLTPETNINVSLKAQIYDNEAFGTKAFGGGGLAVINHPSNDLNFNVNIDGGNISNNSTKLYGGGLYIENCNLSFTDNGTTTINNNLAEYFGGGIAIKGGVLEINTCGIRNNEAHGGGGIYCSYFYDYVHDKDIEGNVIYNKGFITGNKAKGAGGGIFLGYLSNMTITQASDFGVYNNIADGQGDEIYLYSRSNLSLPQADLMAIPGILKEALWIEDYDGNRYRLHNNDKVIAGNQTLKAPAALALGFVGFDLGINSTPESQFDLSNLNNYYHNSIKWPFTPEELQISAANIEKGTKFTLWRSSVDFNSPEIDESDPEWIANIIITDLPQEKDDYGVEPGTVNARVVYHDGRTAETTFRIGNFADARRLFLPGDELDESFYVFMDNFESGSTATNAHPDHYYYQLSMIPAKVRINIKRKYMKSDDSEDNITPVSFNDNNCFHSNMATIGIPKAELTVKHSDYTLDQVEADGNDNVWLEPSVVIARTEPLDNDDFTPTPIRYRIIKLLETNNSNGIQTFEGGSDNESVEAIPGSDQTLSDEPGTYVLEMEYENESGEKFTYGSNISQISTLPTIAGESIEMANESGLYRTTSTWTLHPGSEMYSPAIYRLWFYDDELYEGLSPLHDHRVDVVSSSVEKIIARSDEIDEVDNSVNTGFHPDDTYVSDNTLNVSHLYDHGESALPTETYRIRHYSLVANQADEKRYVVSDATMGVNIYGPTTEINEIVKDNDTPYEPVYYNLSGIKLNRPNQKGIYIVRRGNVVTKELIE